MEKKYENGTVYYKKRVDGNYEDFIINITKILFNQIKVEEFLTENTFEYETYQQWKQNNKNKYQNS